MKNLFFFTLSFYINISLANDLTLSLDSSNILPGDEVILNANSNYKTNPSYIPDNMNSLLDGVFFYYGINMGYGVEWHELGLDKEPPYQWKFTTDDKKVTVYYFKAAQLQEDKFIESKTLTAKTFNNQNYRYNFRFEDPDPVSVPVGGFEKLFFRITYDDGFSELDTPWTNDILITLESLEEGKEARDIARIKKHMGNAGYYLEGLAPGKIKVKANHQGFKTEKIISVFEEYPSGY